MLMCEVVDYDEEEDAEMDEKLPSVEFGESLRPLLIQAAQQVYNDWDEEDTDTYAGGGICHLIADQFCSVLYDHKIECATVSDSNEVHVYVVAKFAEGVYSIDLHYSYYEEGGGYSWKKIPNVVLDPSDISFYGIDSDPESFSKYIEDY